MSYFNFDPSRELDIIPMGRVAIDFNPIDIHKPLEESRNFNKYVGGSPANIAVGMAKLSKKVGFISKVSDDQFGRFVTGFFEERGIDTSNITIAKNGESLGLTFTEIKSTTESSILMYRENVADLNMEPQDISAEYIKKAKILLVSGTCLAQSPSREAALTAIEYAKQNGVLVVFDIDYRVYTWKSDFEIALYYSLVTRMSDIVLGSREEFTLMERLIDPDNQDDLKTASRCHEFGNKIVVIKHGKEGSTAYTDDGKQYKIKPFPIELLKSFGGGDAYASAFLYGLLEGWEMIDALEFASASAAMLVSAHSCSEAMPTVDEIKEFITKKKSEFGENVARG